MVNSIECWYLLCLSCPVVSCSVRSCSVLFCSVKCDSKHQGVPKRVLKSLWPGLPAVLSRGHTIVSIVPSQALLCITRAAVGHLHWICTHLDVNENSDCSREIVSTRTSHTLSTILPASNGEKCWQCKCGITRNPLCVAWTIVTTCGTVITSTRSSTGHTHVCENRPTSPTYFVVPRSHAE